MAVCLKCDQLIPKIDDKNPKISCHGCERLICVKCSGLLATELRVIMLQSPTLKYLCSECTLGVRQLPALRKQVSEMRQEIEALKTSRSQGINMETVISEINDREKRSRNVILFGIPELSSVDDIELRKNHDTKKVREVLADIHDSEAPVSVIRLGKLHSNQSPRPLKLIFSSRPQAMRILKNSKKLRRGIVAKNDQTPYQRI